MTSERTSLSWRASPRTGCRDGIAPNEEKEEIPCTETADGLTCESAQTDRPLNLTVEGDTMTLESPDSDPCVMTLTRAEES